MVAGSRRHAAVRAHGTAYRPVDPPRQLADGATLPFVKLVLATGSRPIRLNVPGMDLPGVMTFRDLGDVGAIEAARGRRIKAVVIGGGLLGLEAAYGLGESRRRGFGRPSDGPAYGAAARRSRRRHA